MDKESIDDIAVEIARVLGIGCVESDEYVINQIPIRVQLKKTFDESVNKCIGKSIFLESADTGEIISEIVKLPINTHGHTFYIEPIKKLLESLF